MRLAVLCLAAVLAAGPSRGGPCPTSSPRWNAISNPEARQAAFEAGRTLDAQLGPSPALSARQMFQANLDLIRQIHARIATENQGLSQTNSSGVSNDRLAGPLADMLRTDKEMLAAVEGLQELLQCRMNQGAAAGAGLGARGGAGLPGASLPGAGGGGTAGLDSLAQAMRDAQVPAGGGLASAPAARRAAGTGSDALLAAQRASTTDAARVSSEIEDLLGERPAPAGQDDDPGRSPAGPEAPEAAGAVDPTAAPDPAAEGDPLQEERDRVAARKAICDPVGSVCSSNCGASQTCQDRCGREYDECLAGAAPADPYAAAEAERKKKEAECAELLAYKGGPMQDDYAKAARRWQIQGEGRADLAQHRDTLLSDGFWQRAAGEIAPEILLFTQLANTALGLLPTSKAAGTALRDPEAAAELVTVTGIQAGVVKAAIESRGLAGARSVMEEALAAAARDATLWAAEEVNAPFAAIAGVISSLGDYDKSSQERAQMKAEIQAQVRRLDKLIQEFAARQRAAERDLRALDALGKAIDQLCPGR